MNIDFAKSIAVSRRNRHTARMSFIGCAIQTSSSSLSPLCARYSISSVSHTPPNVWNR
jgi:hypothetical protein